MKVKNQRGSASVIALCLVLVLTIMSAGVAFMMNTEGKLATENKDLIEAKYAAEAGAKRAIIEFEKINNSQTPSWTWLNQDKAFIDDIGKKKYKVIIYEKGDTTKTNVTPVTTADKTYTIQSTGTVNGVSRTVIVSVEVSAGGNSAAPPSTPGYIGDVVLYSGQTIAVKNNTDVNGSPTYSVGDTTSKKAIVYDTGYSELANQKPLFFPVVSYFAGTPDNYPNITISNVDGTTTGYDLRNATLLKNSTTNIVLNESNDHTAYSLGSWAPNSGSITITGHGVIFINGNFVFNTNQGSIICTDPAGVFIIVAGSLDGNGANGITINKAAMLVYGDILGFKNNFTITGALSATGSVTDKNNATFNYDAKVASTWLPTTSNNGSPSEGSAAAKLVDKSWKLK